MSVASERRAFQALVAAEREAAAAVEDALTSAEFSGAPSELKTMAVEIHHLRTCIERCKSAERQLYKQAQQYLERAERLEDEFEEPCFRFRATICRTVAAELAKALEGF